MADSLAEAIEWAKSLTARELQWNLLVLADDPAFHSDTHRKALVHVVLKKIDAPGL